ncbi:MAG: sulfatase-like hydrolase/transferase [Planctomycetota bacterium]
MKKRPNILWYCTDQQRFDTIGALGNPDVRTPVVDQLVRDGVAFTHAYCQSPICTPSRSSFMTGMYPSRIHNTRNGNETFPEHPPVITKLIAESGYRCGMIGKFHLQSSGRRTEPRIDDGFTFWKFSHAPLTIGRRAITTPSGSALKEVTWTHCGKARIGFQQNCIKQHGQLRRH